MKARVLISFFDKQENVDREVGEEFECTEDRFKEILAACPDPLVKKVITRKKKTPAKE